MTSEGNEILNPLSGSGANFRRGMLILTGCVSVYVLLSFGLVSEIEGAGFAASGNLGAPAPRFRWGLISYIE